MNNKIECGVKDCTYLKDSYCSKKDVYIGGYNATDMQETVCKSFATNCAQGGYTNAVEMTHGQNAASNINCEAEECMHNDKCRCSLGTVGVSCVCPPNNCECCQETFCGSFEQK